MMQIFSIAVFFAAFINGFVVGAHGPVRNGSECGQTAKDRADLCVARMFLIGDRSQRYRETLADMHTYCRGMTGHQNCIKQFSRKCLSQFSRQITNILLFGINKETKRICASDDSKLAFTKIAACANINIEREHDCMDAYLDDLQFTVDADSKTKVPLTCCNFYKFKRCVRQTMETLGPRKCPKTSVDGLMAIVHSYAGDVLELICGDYEEGSKKCQEVVDIGQSLMAQSERNNRANKGQKKIRSVLPLFLEIFNNL